MDDTLKISHLVLLQSWFQALPSSLRNVPISEAKKLLKKKPYVLQAFAKRLKKKIDGDLPWVAKDVDLLFGKLDKLPGLVPKSPPAKRAFRARRRSGPLSLEKNLVYYEKTLYPVLDSSKISPEQKSIIEAALLFVGKGLRPVIKQISRNFNVENDWKLPNGSLMLFGSDFDVKPHEDEKRGEGTPWEDRIADTRPHSSEDIDARDAYNSFDLRDGISKHAPLTRLERQILLLKCRSDISVKEIAKELRKPIKSVSNTYYNARRKMDAWLASIGMKEILRDHQLQRDHFLFNPPPHKVVRLPSLWDDDLGKTSSPLKAWFNREQDQDFLKSLIPSEDEKPWCW